MRKLNLFTLIIASFALIMTGCEGPAGPMGPAGTDGIDGTDGTNGVAGNAVCLACHNTAVKTAITADWFVSGHGVGANVAYAGGRNNCAMCHSHEGFLETQHTGQDTTAAAIPLPQAVQCATCHDFHSTLDFDGDGKDVALRTAEAVTFFVDKTTVVDMGGSSNLCVNCHQPRSVPPVDDGTGNYENTSTRFGPHYGAQSTVVEGIHGYEVAGTVAYPTANTHRSGASCTSCHMAASTVAGEGGHTWNPTLGACTSCHSSATNFDVNGAQTAMDALHVTLGEKLVAAGLLTVGSTGSLSPAKGTFPIDQAGALWNYRMIYYDHSKGIHNPKYVKALLQNSIEVFN